MNSKWIQVFKCLNNLFKAFKVVQKNFKKLKNLKKKWGRIIKGSSWGKKFKAIASLIELNLYLNPKEGTRTRVRSNDKVCEKKGKSKSFQGKFVRGKGFKFIQNGPFLANSKISVNSKYKAYNQAMLSDGCGHFSSFWPKVKFFKLLS